MAVSSCPPRFYVTKVTRMVNVSDEEKERLQVSSSYLAGGLPFQRHNFSFLRSCDRRIRLEVVEMFGAGWTLECVC
jgi:hypothetical protein